MGFSTTKGRYASFGIVTSLPSQLIDQVWYLIDNYLKGVFPLPNLLKIQLINKNGKIQFCFKHQSLPISILIDSKERFDPFYPTKVIVIDKDGIQTILLPDEVHFHD
ncbi:TPA: DUF960 domain-containing protein [Streptococcus suis]|nr:DUF960 domain-containing protein [Streptococcus suis]